MEKRGFRIKISDLWMLSILSNVLNRSNGRDYALRAQHGSELPSIISSMVRMQVFSKKYLIAKTYSIWYVWFLKKIRCTKLHDYDVTYFYVLEFVSSSLLRLPRRKISLKTWCIALMRRREYDMNMLRIHINCSARYKNQDGIIEDTIKYV